MAPPRRRRVNATRTFITTSLFIAFLAATSILFSWTSFAASPSLLVRSATTSKHDCRYVHQVKDQCAFVQRYCDDEQPGLLSYLTFHYCSSLGKVPGLPFIVLTIWLGLLFTTIGIAASDFFSVNLGTISSVLHLPESLAGVTFLAFGNGSPDVFSTFAAMNSNSGSMALGELIGAASFITAVVAGSMALVREFSVTKDTFIRDILFFITAICFTMSFLADGEMHWWECLIMVGYYAFYVVVVVSWHWVSSRRKRRQDAKAGSAAAIDPVVEPYRDDPSDAQNDGSATRHLPRQRTGTGDLERNVRIQIDSAEDEEERERLIAAEMTNSMRVNRPRRTHSHATAPIRPSLIGALEFRSVLASLQKERNLKLAPLHRANSDYVTDGLAPSAARTGRRSLQALETQPEQRERALSSGDLPLNRDQLRPRHLTLDTSVAPINKALRSTQSLQATDSPLSTTRNGRLAPPYISEEAIASPIGEVYHGADSRKGSLTLLPFPAYHDSPLPITPGTPRRATLPTVSEGEPESTDASLDPENEPRRLRWWPYSVLVAPEILTGTLFPTLRDWRSKRILTKAVSLISAPMIFLLVLTLPVVESEALDEDEQGDGTASHGGQPLAVNDLAQPVSVDCWGSIEPDNEWQEYQRRARAMSHRRSPSSLRALASRSGIATPLDLGTPAIQEEEIDPLHVATAPRQSDDHDATITEDEPEPDDWNRWLLALQLFTGPLFTMLVIWAKYLDEPVSVLVTMILSSLLASAVLTGALLLLTSPTRKPAYHFLACFLGFVISIIWISTIAEEVVGILKAVGVILGWSDAILGLTIFAMGNSVSDLVADITVARLGYPVMALSACFGGPMLNILLGIGIGGLYMTTGGAHKGKGKHGKTPGVSKGVYHLDVTGSLVISAVTVLITLLVLVIGVPLNGWVMSRRIGYILVVIWTIGTVVNVVVEAQGIWKDVAW